jgi:hypothetical protein
METKLAAINGQRLKVDRIILENIVKYTDLRRAMQEFVENPTDSETTELLDLTFKRLASGLEEIGNSISVLAEILINENGTVTEIDGRDEGNGIRLQ